MSQPRFTIDLWDNDLPGLIIACKSGVTYTNQVGGYACRHPEIEGVFVPLPGSMSEKLDAHFTGPKWCGHCYDAIDDETASTVDEILAELAFVSTTVRVDRKKLADSCEAWIWVTISSNGYLWPGLSEENGVLTWGNSD
ncbi:DUF6210 family protein [Prosthecobacter sp.]|uniref:DUF6210 family protein n=1 Tax=Prosthecobacter sp. TaxID=1965333 RepID=UPI001D52480B|nr:DUF6210 family protein [Prosthecobacter sp.]MCB1277693.1 hypothetical protein [Prosthecobacter sp.]